MTLSDHVSQEQRMSYFDLNFQKVPFKFRTPNMLYSFIGCRLYLSVSV
jgi:hypothetical protein